MTDIFLDGINKQRAYAGIFEADDDVGWFYLYKIYDPEDVNGKLDIIGAVQVCRGKPDFAESDLEIRWNASDTRTSLFIKGKECAYFDLTEGRGVPGLYPDEPLSSGQH